MTGDQLLTLLALPIIPLAVVSLASGLFLLHIYRSDPRTTRSWLLRALARVGLLAVFPAVWFAILTLYRVMIRTELPPETRLISLLALYALFLITPFLAYVIWRARRRGAGKPPPFTLED